MSSVQNYYNFMYVIYVLSIYFESYLFHTLMIRSRSFLSPVFWNTYFFSTNGRNFCCFRQSLAFPGYFRIDCEVYPILQTLCQWPKHFPFPRTTFHVLIWSGSLSTRPSVELNWIISCRSLRSDSSFSDMKAFFIRSLPKLIKIFSLVEIIWKV